MNLDKIANIDKCILFDVLHVIDKAGRGNIENYFGNGYMLMREGTVKIYKDLYETAADIDDKIAAAFYIQNGDKNPNRFTAIYTFLFGKACELSSFESVVTWFTLLKRTEFIEHVVDSCIGSEKNVNKYDLFSTGDILSVLKNTKLPLNVKQSIVLLIRDYDEFIKCLVLHMKTVYERVFLLYSVGVDAYRKMKYALKKYLREHGIKNIVTENVFNELQKDNKERDRVFVLSLALLESGRILKVANELLCIRGYFRLQRHIHSKGFTIF